MKQRLIKQHLKNIKKLQYKSGLFSASGKRVKTGYNKAWLRDNFYICLAFESINDWETVKKVYDSILHIFLLHEYKIDHAIENKPLYSHQYIHARYNPRTFDEFWEEWGNKQNDAIGAILFKIGQIEKEKNIKILETEAEKRIIQKLIRYLESIEYWKDRDSGMWEEEEEVHASSIGACLAGLKFLRKKKDIVVHKSMIERGEGVLKRLLPRESENKFIDMSLLSLIYPYNIVNAKQRDEILKNVEYHLVKNKGVIRYKGDSYYNKNEDNYSAESEWPMGFSWLAIIYNRMGNKKKAKYYLKKSIETINKRNEIPELYYSNSNKHNKNTPLGWAESLFIVALNEI